MIGQPMCADGFEALAAEFPDRTVVTYDPRGLGRSTTRRDGRNDQNPEDQAADLHALVEHLGAGPVDLFASSGGAVTALTWAATHPEDLATVVAHEPPVMWALPDAEAAARALRARWRGLRRARFRRGDGGLHRDDQLAGRVHRRVLRAACRPTPHSSGSRPRTTAPATTRCSPSARDACRRPARPRGAAQRHAPDRARRRRGDRRRRSRHAPRAVWRAARAAGDDLPEPPRRFRERRGSVAGQVGRVRCAPDRGPRATPEPPGRAASHDLRTSNLRKRRLRWRM